MGTEAEDILASFGLSEYDSNKYNTVEENLKLISFKKRNMVFERAKFNHLTSIDHCDDS